MAKPKIGLHEVGYERLSEAEKRRPHPPTTMKSGNSKGPVKMWICTRKWCESVEYTYGHALTPPTCFGGAAWSFTTNGVFDPRIHKAHVASEVW